MELPRKSHTVSYRTFGGWRRWTKPVSTGVFLSGNESRLNWRTNPQSIPVNVPRERKAMGQTDVDDGVDRG